MVMLKIVLGVSSAYCASFLRGQVKFLVQHGFAVVIISGPGEAIRRLAAEEGAVLYELNFSKRISPLSDLALLARIVRILRKEKPDLVNAGNPKSGFLIMLACWLTGIKKRVFTLHGLLSDTQTGIRRSIISLAERVCCRIAKRVIVVSPSLKLHAEQRRILEPGKGLVIENGSCNGVDAVYFSRSEALHRPSRELRSALKMEDHFTIGFVGRISIDKGIDILLDAFARLKDTFPLLQLLVVGPVEKEAAAAEEITQKLHFTKDLYHTGMLSDVRPAYHLMDVLVLPSRREGLGNVLLEASAMELPVVAADIPGCRDALVHRVTGVLFEKGNVDALANTLDQLIRSDVLRKQYGRNGRKFVEDTFPQEKIWEGQLRLYQQL